MGRNKVKAVTIVPTQQLLEDLNAYAETKGKSRHGIILKAIEAYIYGYNPNQIKEKTNV